MSDDNLGEHWNVNNIVVIFVAMTMGAILVWCFKLRGNDNESDDFVADGEGRHIFTRTNREHNKAKKKLQNKRKELRNQKWKVKI